MIKRFEFFFFDFQIASNSFGLKFVHGLDFTIPALKRLCVNNRNIGRRNFQVAVLLMKRKLKLAATIMILIIAIF